MANWDWSRLRDCLRLGKSWNRERLQSVWRERPALIVVAGLIVLLAALWWFGAWLLENSEDIRNLMLAIGVGAAIFGGWIAYQRSRTDRMRAETDRLRQVTESFAKAVELLGHADMSVRMGAIYALERIAKQNRDEHRPDYGDAHVIREVAFRAELARKAVETK